MTRTLGSGIAALRMFVLGLHQDWEAVLAGLPLFWSNSPVEEQRLGGIGGLRLLRRQMYERASFPVLRALFLQLG